MARKTLSDHRVRAIKPAAKRQTIPDPELSGHYLRVMPSGVKSFVCVVRDGDGRQRWVTLGRADHISVEDSRARARDAIAASAPDCRQSSRRGRRCAPSAT